MRVTIIEHDGTRSHANFGETSPVPTLDWNMDEWRKRGWIMTEEGYALMWSAAARVVPERHT